MLDKSHTRLTGSWLELVSKTALLFPMTIGCESASFAGSLAIAREVFGLLEKHMQNTKLPQAELHLGNPLDPQLQANSTITFNARGTHAVCVCECAAVLTFSAVVNQPWVRSESIALTLDAIEEFARQAEKRKGVSVVVHRSRSHGPAEPRDGEGVTPGVVVGK